MDMFSIVFLFFSQWRVFTRCIVVNAFGPQMSPPKPHPPHPFCLGCHKCHQFHIGTLQLNSIHDMPNSNLGKCALENQN